MARATTTLSKALLPFPSEFEFCVIQINIDVATQRLNEVMQHLELRWLYKPTLAMGVVLAPGNVWSRAARRRKEQGSPALKNESTFEDEPALAVKVKLVLLPEGGVSIKLRWLQGQDSKLFESFCGMMKRQITEAVNS